MSEFAPGDVVRLKSGGPKMTVVSMGNEAMTSTPRVWCEWFDDKHKTQSGDFAPTSLEKVDPKPPGIGTLRVSR